MKHCVSFIPFLLSCSPRADSNMPPPLQLSQLVNFSLMEDKLCRGSSTDVAFNTSNSIINSNGRETNVVSTCKTSSSNGIVTQKTTVVTVTADGKRKVKKIIRKVKKKVAVFKAGGAENAKSGEGGVVVSAKKELTTYQRKKKKTGASSSINVVGSANSSVDKENGEEKKHELGRDDIGNGEVVVAGGEVKDEVEEGELGTLENGDAAPKGATTIAGNEVDKWRKGDADKGDLAQERSRNKEFGSWRGSEDGIEKGEFVPERWEQKDDYSSHGRMRPHESSAVKDKGWRCDRDSERTPPSGGKYNSSDDSSQRKEFIRSGSSQHSKRPPSRWDPERDSRVSSKMGYEDNSYENEHFSGRDYSSGGNRLKRYSSNEVDISEHKLHGDFSDYAIGLKSRRISDDGRRTANSEHFSRQSVERPHRNSSSKISSSDRYAPSHFDSSRSSKVVYERHGHSPGRSDWSPHEKVRYQDHYDRSPVHKDRSPYARWELSPYDRRDRSPYDWKEMSPYDRREKSPYDHDRREKSLYDRRDRSPYDQRERSPYDRRERSPYDRREKSPYARREKSPYARREKSPYDGSPCNRSRHDDFRNRSPNNAERSPQSRPRRSTLDRHKPTSCRETVRKIGASEKRHSKLKDEKVNHTSLKGKDSQMSFKECQGGKVVHKGDLLVEDKTSVQLKLLDQNQSLGSNCKESVKVNGVTEEEPPSMEEDMDICDTPPHVTRSADSNTGKWYYLDHLGVEQGPSKLSDLKALMEEGSLVSDHLIKHLESDRWVTVENASSPLVIVNFPHIVPDIITQLVSPPQAPGNLLVETEDSGKHDTELTDKAPASTTVFGADESSALFVPLEDLHIDQRVDTLLEGVTVIPGREIEILGEALQMTFELPQWEKVGFSEGSPLPLAPMEEQESGLTTEEASEYRAVAPFDMDITSASGYSSGWFSGPWSCKGGDWKRNDDAVPDKSSRKKIVLNDGFPLCKMPKSGSEDPRVHKKEELYYPSQLRRLDLPCWAFTFSDDKAESNVAIKLGQANPAVKGVKGTILPVVRINACVVKSHGSFVSETRPKPRARDKYSSRSSRSHSVTNDTHSSSAEVASSSKTFDDHESKGVQKQNALINYHKDRLCNSNDLQLHVGGWYYLDGAGHERGPLSVSELQVLVDEAHIQRCSSVFRKYDNIWVPLSTVIASSNRSSKCIDSKSVVLENSSQMQDAALHDTGSILSLFHRSHPQFIGYALGRLHELVMKSYRSREFAASINEVLDPWISDKQPKKEMDKHIFNPSSERSSPRDSNRLWRSETDHDGKRARMASDGSDKDDEIDGDLMVQQDDSAFENLCGNVTFKREDTGHSLVVSGSWGLLDGHMLARVFHFLRADVKSLAVVALTCKHWRSVVGFYKGIANQVDLSPFGPMCTGSMISNIMRGYNKEKVTSVVLARCTNVNSTSLEEILQSYPSLSLIDIRGCSQLEELCLKFPNVQWIKSRCSRLTSLFPDSSSKLKSVQQITQKMCGINKGDADPLRAYFDSVERRESASQSFRQSLYQRSKVFDARKSSSILSRDARLRRWAVKKTEIGYKKMESTIAVSLKDIMKENTFDFFVPKVSEIEEKMKNGYYNNRGLSSVKEDIRRMCRDALKVKNRGEAGDMNHVVTSFIELATRLEDNPNSWNQKNMRIARDNSSASVLSDSSKYKKKLSKLVTDRKYGNKNGGEEFASDREVNTRLSKLNKLSMDSGSDTSDEFDRSSDDANSETESTASDTESDADLCADSGTRESKAEGFFMEDEGVDFITDEREWGARMTTASLVPPITRKYEVINHYVIVADEEEVRRKMKVSLPEDYAEKLSVQKSGSENLDMEIPEVKAYKPRKTLGDEVVEQEVYGIDPYTHNLLLDSMPEELLWTLNEKHAFIEDVLLAMLNKQAREFTGSGNTPMMYSLQPIVEEIQRTSDEVKDVKTMQMCQGILKAIANRPDDKYVAYRKGLGVVCNKDGGFSADDFVVEFLGEVYPAWRWFEKQDGIRSLQKNSKDPAPEFYNIYLERPKGDADGYDLVVVDAMHKANYASRICHSCHPNCEAKVTAVDGQYQIGIYAVREIQYGEEISFDYNSVTESKEEYEASVCLCGSQICRGSYLNLTGEGAFQKVLKDWHGLLDRYQLMIEACESNSVSEEDYIDLGKAGLGSCLLAGLPDWLIAYSARLVRFINFERTKLPEEILRHNLEEKKKYFTEISLEVEKSDAEVQAEGVYNQRLQNLALTLDKVRYVMRCVFGDPKRAPPPLERLSPRAAASFLWKGEGSLVEELLQCIAPHMDSSLFTDMKAKILAHDPLGSDDIHKELQRSLLWMRDEVRNLPCTYKCRHDAAADLIHIYAYTKCFFRIREYDSVISAPVLISPLDLGPKYAEKMGPGLQEYCKTYGSNYCLGQLINWHNQTNADPDCSLVRASRGCVSLPEIGSFYAKAQKPSRQRIYGPQTVRFMLSRMEKQPQKPWPKDLIWSFHDSPKVIGSPMLDSTLKKCPLSKDMMHWLKNRPAIFQAMWDR